MNGSENARAGSGLWYVNDDPRNVALRLPDSIEQTNNAGEAVAVLEAVRRAPHNALLRIKSDSQVTIDGLTKNLQSWEDKGWIGVKYMDILIPTVALMRARKGHTILEKVKGHSGSEGNEPTHWQDKEPKSSPKPPILPKHFATVPPSPKRKSDMYD